MSTANPSHCAKCGEHANEHLAISHAFVSPMSDRDADRLARCTACGIGNHQHTISCAVAAGEARSDADLRALWREAGGSFHGPNIETGTMPEAKLLPLLRRLVVREPPKGDDRDSVIRALHERIDRINVAIRSGSREIAVDLSSEYERPRSWASEFCGCRMRDGEPIKREACAIHHAEKP